MHEKKPDTTLAKSRAFDFKSTVPLSIYTPFMNIKKKAGTYLLTQEVMGREWTGAGCKLLRQLLKSKSLNFFLTRARALSTCTLDPERNSLELEM